MAFASPFIINILNKIKYPYNLSTANIRLAEKALQQEAVMRGKVQQILAERSRLESGLLHLACVQKVFSSDANFLLVRVSDADAIYQFLCNKGIVVRNRNREMHCENCLRITVGSPSENDRLLAALQQYPKPAK